MKLIHHLNYRKNRFLSYYFLDFSPKERLLLWKNLIKNEVFNSKTREIENKIFTGKLLTYIISLEHRYDRRKHIVKEINDNGIRFKFFTATDGERLTKADLKYITKRSKTNLSKGSIGCAISHIKIWESISTQDSNNIFLILEDDVILLPNFVTKFKILLSELPVNFDLIYIGGFNNRGRDIQYFVNKYLFKSYNPRRGFYSYIINPKSAKKLIDLIKPFDLSYGGIDTIIGKLTRKGKLEIYQIYPSIVDVDLSFKSNIFNYSLRNFKEVEE